MYTSKQIDLDISDNQRILAKASDNKANKHIIKATKLEFSRDMQRMRRKELKSLRKLKKGLIAVVIIEALALGYFCYKSVITSRASEPTRIEQSLDGLDGLRTQENQKEALKEYPPLSTPSNSYSEKDLEILSRIICGEAGFDVSIENAKKKLLEIKEEALAEIEKRERLRKGVA